MGTTKAASEYEDEYVCVGDLCEWCMCVVWDQLIMDDHRGMWLTQELVMGRSQRVINRLRHQLAGYVTSVSHSTWTGELYRGHYFH